MDVDARHLTKGTSLETDVCVVGAGPAGLVLAAELLAKGLRVVVLESGAEETDESVLALNEGIVKGDPYAGLAATRHRGIGGTTAIWNTSVERTIGAKYVLLDPVDFEARPGRELGGWPFGFGELRPYYERALAWCGLNVELDPARPAGPAGTGILRPAAPLAPAIYRLGTRKALLEPALETIRAAPDACLYSNATVVGLETAGSRTRVVRASVRTPGGPAWRVGARLFVVAAGAVENARLLLSSSGPEGLGNEYGWVGRCFMEHPRDTALRLHPSSPAFYREAAFYDVHEDPHGQSWLGRLAIDASVLRSDDLPNASGVLLPVLRRGVRIARRLLGPLTAADRVQRLVPSGGHDWSRHPMPERVFDGMTVLLNLEQPPHPDNRIRLGRRRDSLGVPRVELHWRWRPDDQRRLERLRKMVAAALEEGGFGRVEIDATARVDPNAHHHSGTTRMHEDPERGVVDPHGRVHSMENLYVAGASVFPTAGFANPVLTIVALSVCLAEHLAVRVR